MRRRIVAVLMSASLATAGALATTASPSAALTVTGQRLVLGVGGAQPNGDVLDTRVTPDRKWAVFTSDASNLVAGDTNGVSDVFIEDLQTGATLRIVPPGEDPADGDSYEPSVCDDGSVVAFTTDSDLYGGEDDTNFSADVYVYDRDTDDDGVYDEVGASGVRRIGVDPDGFEAEFGTSQGAIAGDCSWVAFVSDDPLVTNDRNDATDVYARDLAGTDTIRISRGTTSDGGGGFLPAISQTGRFVTYQSYATDIASGSGGFKFGTYLRDRDADNDGNFDESGSASTNEYVNRSTSGEVSTGAPDAAAPPAITPDGKCVAFKFYNGFQLTADAPVDGIFVRNRQTGTTVLASKNADGLTAVEAGHPAISADCRYVSFDTQDPDLLTTDTNPDRDVLIRDTQANTLRLLSLTGTGSGADGGSVSRQIFDGTSGLITSSASNIGGADGGNGLRDPFIVEIDDSADTTPPTLKSTSISGVKGWTLAKNASFSGGAQDAGGVAAIIQTQAAAWNGAFGGTWTDAQVALGTNVSVTATPTIAEGQTICFRQRAVDTAGNTAGPSAPSCVARPLTAGKVKAGPGWTNSKGSKYYGGTSKVATKKGSKLSVTGASGRTIAIVATTCKGCGSVEVSFGGKRKTISLDSRTTRNQQVIDAINLPTAKSGTVTVTVTSKNKTVRIEGLAIRKTVTG